MSETINVLLVSDDQRFRAEMQEALHSLEDLHTVLHHAADLRQAVESARSRRPHLALVEMHSDVRPLQTFAREAALISPETTVAGVFRPDSFGHDVSESTLLIEAIRAGVKDFLHRPVSSTELSDLLRRSGQSVARSVGPLGRIVSFASNKGGVGKTTLAVNAACGLALRHSGRVLLIDASLQMGTCASLLDLRPATSLLHVARESVRLDETLVRKLAAVHSSGLHLLSAPADAVDGSEINDEVLSRILTLARRAYDFVIVDTFPMLDSVVVAILDHSDRTYIVLENVVPTLLGGVGFLHVLKGLGVSAARQRIILNRHTRLPGSIQPSDAANRLGRAIDHVIPFDTQFVVGANIGEPYVLQARRWFGCDKQLQALVDDIDTMTDMMNDAGEPSESNAEDAESEADAELTQTESAEMADVEQETPL